MKGTSKAKGELWRGYNAVNNNLKCNFTLDKQGFIADEKCEETMCVKITLTFSKLKKTASEGFSRLSQLLLSFLEKVDDISS